MLPGKVKVDIDYIAMKLGLAKSTVSKAMNGRPNISAATREKVRALAAKLNYVPDRLAQSLKTKRSYLIGLVMHEMKRDFFIEIARGVTLEAQRNGCQAVFASSEGSTENERALVRDFLSRRIDGLVVIPCIGGDHSHLQEVALGGYPLVIADNYVEGVDAPFVGTDFELGGYLAVKHLVKNGHRHLGLLLGPRDLPSTPERLAGYTRALEESGLRFDAERVRYGDYSFAAGRAAAEALLAEFPETTAILCGNADLSEGAAAALAKLGKRVPDDLCLMDFGGARLPSVNQKNEEIGQTAARTLFRLINGETPARRNIVKPEIAVMGHSSSDISPWGTAPLEEKG